MTEIRLIDVPAEHTVAIRRQVRTTELATFFDTAFTEVFEALRQAGVEPAGAPFARYHGEPGETLDVEAGFPVLEPFPATGDLVPGTLPAARAAEVIHIGSYDGLRETYARLEAWLTEQGLHGTSEMWERYDSGPASDPDPATWHTRILWPVSAPQVTA